MLTPSLPPQDENDNPPEFSLPSYIINIPENIIAGMFEQLYDEMWKDFSASAMHKTSR